MWSIKSKNFKDKFEAEIEKACSNDNEDFDFKVDVDTFPGSIIIIPEKTES